MSLAFFAETAVKATVILASAWVVTSLMARASAAARHLVWSTALVAALAVPIGASLLPAWPVPIVRAWPTSELTAWDPGASLSGARGPGRDRDARSVVRGWGPEIGVSSPADRAITAQDGLTWSAAPKPFIGQWRELLPIVWVAGATLVFARLLIGIVSVWWIARRTREISDPSWLALLGAAARQLRLSTRVLLLESSCATLPLSWGVWRPVLLMPAGADGWGHERREVVLLHELAHVKRRDCLTQLLGQAACGIYWFNPLVWLAASRLRSERERACDDLVLAAGTKAPDYADHLLEIATSSRAAGLRAFRSLWSFSSVSSGATVAMARPTQLEGRLLDILDRNRSRRTPTRRSVGLTVALFVALAMPLAALQPWAERSRESAGPTEARSVRLPAMTPVPAHTSEADHDTVDTDRPLDQREKPLLDAPAENVSTWIDSVLAGVKGGVIGGIVGGITGGVPEGVKGGVATDDPENEASEANEADQAPTRNADDEDRELADETSLARLAGGELDGLIEVDKVLAHARHREEPQAAAPVAPVSDDQAETRRVVEALVSALADPQKDVRQQAASALARMRQHPRAIAGLTSALKDSDPEVRQEAAAGLARSNRSAAASGLLLALKDAHAPVRREAASGLGRMRDPRFIDALGSLLTDQDAEVRQHAVEALGRLRATNAVVPLAEALKDSSADVRQQAAEALAQLRAPSAVEPLMAALKDSDAEVRQQAAYALGQIRDPRAAAALSATLSDRNADVRQQVAYALGQIRSRAGVPGLIIALKDSDADVRQQAAYALGQIRDERAIDPLTAALKDPDADVREQAAYALGQVARTNGYPKGKEKERDHNFSVNHKTNININTNTTSNTNTNVNRK